MKQNNYTIVPMEAAHVPQIAALETVCFSDPWVDAAIRSELENPLSLWLVALDGTRVAGYIGSQTVLGEADIMNVAVDPADRRQGLARMLLDAGFSVERVYLDAITAEDRPDYEYLKERWPDLLLHPIPSKLADHSLKGPPVLRREHAIRRHTGAFANNNLHQLRIRLFIQPFCAGTKQL